MKKLGILLLSPLAIASLLFLSAQAQNPPQPAPQAGQQMGNSTHPFPNAPQDMVVCTGWHALCTSSPDCTREGDIANCDCMRVNETHIVATAEIQDIPIKRLTQLKCTNAHPCAVDEAPICKTIASGQYEVNYVKYPWVSTYSYRGWCSILARGVKLCDPTAPDYTGDTAWAICDVAPCTEITNPSDPQRPLSCQCRVQENQPFAGMNNSCTGQNGGIMSSMPTWAWDFQNNTYPFPMPGYEYVKGACSALESDPPPTTQAPQ
jgi:hypothetical protein